ncbi:MFS transporter [Paraburkholderia panacisoli]|nr:MFS transporter [Paraburkholderia panacisoli]
MGSRSILAMRAVSELAASHRWKVLGVGFAANASFSAAFSGIPTTAVFLRSGYHLNNHGLGLVLGMLGLGIALSELPWGLLTDRWGDRRVLLLGLLSTAAALAGLALFVAPSGARVPSVTTLALGLLLVGLLGGSVNGSSGRAVMAWFREGERGLAMSIRQTAVPAGGGLGALMLPALASRCGFASVYTVLALACAITALFAWLWLHEPSHVSADGEGVGRTVGHANGSSAAMSAGMPRANAATSTAMHGSSAAAGTALHGASAVAAAPARRSPLRDTRIWRVALGAGALCVPQIAIVTFGTVFLHDFSRAGVLAISVTMAAVQTGAAIARVWSGSWTDRRGNRREYMRICSLLTAGLFALLALLTGLAGLHHAAMAVMFALMIVLGGVSASAWHGVAFTELATLAGTSRAGTALAIGNTCVFLMLFLTPLAIPPLLSVGSWPMVWAVASACALIALPVFPRAVPKGGAQTARACDAT